MSVAGPIPPDMSMRNCRIKPPHREGLLTRLRRSRRGNVLVIVAGAMIPLLGMVGAGIDVSRLYMARSRLQQACDAGALAGRRTMADPAILTTANLKTAQNFFDYNYPKPASPPNTVTRNFARGAYPGIVTGTAEDTLPTIVMKIFGYRTVKLSVTCESTLIIPNTDIMFVLDVTGSMNDTPSGDSQNKIASLRAAVKDFFVALGAGAATGPGRVRYGFMPYSSNVNVGKLVLAENRSWIAGGNGPENWHYQSRTPVTATKREANYGTESARSGGTTSDSAVTYPNGTATTDDQTYYGLTLDQCRAKVVDGDRGPIGSPVATLTADEAPPAYPDNVRDRTYTVVQKRGWRDWQGTFTEGTRTRSSVCATRYRDGTFDRTTTGSATTTPVTWSSYEEFSSWRYENRTLDVSPLVAGGAAPNPAYYTGRWSGADPNSWGSEMTPSMIEWNGCIEEASTVDNITASSALQPPSDANDLNIDLIPSSTEARWKPFLVQLQYYRENDYREWYWRSDMQRDGYAACPAQASRLQSYTSDVSPTTRQSTSFNTYVDSLQPIGGTYHDIGLIWGARFLSPDGIFSAANSNSAAPGQFAVDRHIVFMTDGTLSTSGFAPDAWGINLLDGRVAATSANDDQLNQSHLRRTSIICEQMRAKGYTVWVIGFGIATMPAELQRCAADSDHWSVASNAAQLRGRFQQIAQLIGGLRLTQ